jgi:hypothetical protein
MNYRVTGEFRAPFRLFPFVEETSPYKVELVLKVRESRACLCSYGCILCGRCMLLVGVGEVAVVCVRDVVVVCVRGGGGVRRLFVGHPSPRSLAAWKRKRRRWTCSCRTRTHTHTRLPPCSPLSQIRADIPEANYAVNVEVMFPIPKTAAKGACLCQSPCPLVCATVSTRCS